MENTPDYNQNILDDVDYSIYHASGGKRFANYIIDIIAFYLFMIVLGFILGLTAPGLVQDLFADDNNSIGGSLGLRVFSGALYILLMFVLEAATKGKTLGKLITGTRAVNLDGSRISVKTALLRSLSRIVPFEPFSAFGDPSNPWHDRWADTYVVDERLSRLPGNK